jgi:hypothetical protein
VPAPTLETGVGESAVLSAVGLAMVASFGVGFVARVGQRVTLAVPHCAAHDDGAGLAEGGPTGLLVLFRSWPYQRAFCELNGVPAAESPGVGRSVAEDRADGPVGVIQLGGGRSGFIERRARLARKGKAPE